VNGLLNNYKLLIQYDGSGYSGWQIQKNQMSVQQKITDSIETILKVKVNLIGSGRTDTGVHALGQVANFRTELNIDQYRFLYSLNSILPPDISIRKMEQVAESFHSRFDARKRTYIYLISNHKSPFYHNYSYFYHFNVDCKRLNILSESMLGQHDFSSFSKKNSDTSNKICEIYDTHWKQSRGLIMFYICADRFLHGMVRAITGTLLHALKNNLDNLYIDEVINSKDREKAAEAVPARGLFLFKVKY
jgi:tRNA pseudouridine38-40 synthase